MDHHSPAAIDRPETLASAAAIARHWTAHSITPSAIVSVAAILFGANQQRSFMSGNGFHDQAASSRGWGSMRSSGMSKTNAYEWSPQFWRISGAENRTLKIIHP